MTRRYYLPDLPTQGGLVSLPDTEFQHATRVMRVQVGDEIEAFDGNGSESIATITEITRHECHCQSDPTIQIDREAVRRINMGIALPKPDRARELIERLTELGVQNVTPIIAERSQRPPSNSLIEKLRRGVIEACKQCQRNVLMSVADPVKLSDFVSLAADSETSTRWIAHPSKRTIADAVSSCQTNVTALIGPEGGWSDQEVAAAHAAKFEIVGLGRRIFRIETAATFVAARLIDE